MEVFSAGDENLQMKKDEMNKQEKTECYQLLSFLEIFTYVCRHFASNVFLNFFFLLINCISLEFVKFQNATSEKRVVQDIISKKFEGHWFVSVSCYKCVHPL